MYNDLNESSVPPKDKNWVWMLRTRVIEFKDEANKNGVGYYTDKNGNTYRGDWVNNKREGMFIYGMTYGVAIHLQALDLIRYPFHRFRLSILLMRRIIRWPIPQRSKVIPLFESIWI